MLADLSENFIQNVLGQYEIEGARWIISLPEIVREIEKKWSLSVQRPFAELSYHFVAPCVGTDGSESVLKLAIPAARSAIRNEKKVLQCYGGDGAVRVLGFDEECCGLLLERLVPGENLVPICQRDDARSTSIAIRVMKKLLSRPAPAGEFPTLREWVGGLEAARGSAFPRDLAARALDYLEDLAGSSKQSYLLHGDLHHRNILSAGGRFAAIDPKGIVGAAGFEISTFLNNPRGWLLGHPGRKKLQSARLRQFADAFEIDPGELRRWAFAEAVLAAW